jgi:polysaccharide export outer membrane protein
MGKTVGMADLFFKTLVAMLWSIAITGCASTVGFPVDSADQAALADVEVVRLDADNITHVGAGRNVTSASGVAFPTVWDYKVGAGDVLSIIVFNHPELTLPAGPERSAEDSGFRVQRDGTFFYPFVGQVLAAGRSLEDIREELANRLADFISDPQIEVRVAAFNSQRIVVTGEVLAPNQQRLTMQPLTLIEAINAAGGLTDAADARQVFLQRRGQRVVIDLDAFLARGVRNSNPVLRAGDIVTVPERTSESAYLLGEIEIPSVIDLTANPVSLTNALAQQGGISKVRADARGVFVFRGAGNRVTVYQLDTRSPVALLLGTRFYLHPNDVVYVTTSPLQRWNDTISQLLPSVTAIRAVDEAAAVTN